MFNDGKLSGTIRDFPLTFNGTEKITVNSSDELVELVYSEYQDRLKRAVKSKASPKLADVFWFFGIEETIAIADKRTLDILKKYEYLKQAPQTINSAFWMECVVILNRMQPKMF